MCVCFASAPLTHLLLIIDYADFFSYTSANFSTLYPKPLATTFCTFRALLYKS